MKIRNTFVILLGTISFATNVHAWWGLGHMVVANIAYQHLNVEAKSKVEHLLETFQIMYPNIHSFEEMSVWADSLYGEQKIFLEFHWHFVDTPIYADSNHGNAKVDSDNAIWALENMIRIFKANKANDFEQARLLAFLIHIVGDVHQPLHNVSRITTAHPKGDRGGNDFKIKFNGETTGLHQVWDSAFGLFDGDATLENTYKISKSISSTYPVKSFDSKVNCLQPKVWSKESYAIAKDLVYNTDENREPQQDYKEKGSQAAQAAIALAGYRLANLLNELFGG